MLTAVTESEALYALPEHVQGSSQTQYSEDSRDLLPVITSDTEEASRPGEVVINVHDASASFNNESPERLFGHHSAIMEKEIDKIFTYQSKRLNRIDPARQSEVSIHGRRQTTSPEKSDKKFSKKLRDLIQNVRESDCFLLLKFILFIVPLSACFMGLIYEQHCPLSRVTPYLLQLIGGFGILLIATRIALSFRNKLSLSVATLMGYVSIALYWGVTLSLTIEMIPFYHLNPDFENPFSPKYCERTFYFYTFYMNIVAVAIGFVELLMHLPCLTERTGISYIRMT